MRRKMIAGNWKMNGTLTSSTEVMALCAAHADPGVDIVICPPATMLRTLMTATTDHAVAIGGQDCHAAPSGAHTGDISAPMLADSGATHVITGHSERRTDHHEDDALIAAKTKAAWDAGLTAILCIGETEAQYRAGDTLKVLRGQMAASIPDGATPETLVLAYEPVWAIGTGLTPTTDEIGAVHNALRDALVSRFGAQTGHGIRILYGGSVKAANAAEIFAVADVDGALVGGASLKADDFSPIINALEAAV